MNKARKITAAILAFVFYHAMVIATYQAICAEFTKSSLDDARFAEALTICVVTICLGLGLAVLDFIIKDE